MVNIGAATRLYDTRFSTIKYNTPTVPILTLIEIVLTVTIDQVFTVYQSNLQHHVSFLLSCEENFET